MNFTHLSVEKTVDAGRSLPNETQWYYALQMQLKAEYQRKLNTPSGFIRFEKK